MASSHTSGELRVDVRDTSSSVVRVDFVGKSSQPDPDAFLRPLLDELAHRTAQRGGELELHFEVLEFFNSATITAVIRFLKGLPPSLKVRAYYNAKHRWQKIFFDALWVMERTNPNFRIQAVS